MKKVLVADDPMIGQLVKALLAANPRTSDYEVIITQNKNQAKKMFEDSGLGDFSLIVTSMTEGILPELLAAGFPKNRIICLSGFPELSFPELVQNPDLVFLNKPAFMDKLVFAAVQILTKTPE